MYLSISPLKLVLLMGRLKIKDYVVRKTPLLGFLNAEKVNINTRKAGVDP